MIRTTIKFCGESGSGLLSLQKIVSSAIKSLGFYLHADREYPSVIKGGHSMFQIDFGSEPMYSLSNVIDVIVAVDSVGLVNYINDAKEGGVVIHSFDRLDRVSNLTKIAEEKNLKMVYVPARALALELAHTDLVANMVLLGFVWKVLGFELDSLEGPVTKQFASKPKWLEIDLKCIKAGHALKTDVELPTFSPERPAEKPEAILVDGNHALALGAIQCGVRNYYAYPMSPASSVLTYMADMANQAGVVVKQAEDEISAAQMVTGSMHMGVRSFTATSGGGYDLMTETVSLAAISETPFVAVIAQRPGPATGIPTWTCQADLNLAIYSAHGEFPRLVIACSDAASCYELIQHAFNYAETFQIPVIVLTEKLIAEAKYLVAPFEHGKIPIKRGLVTDPEELSKLLSTDRFKITEDGISKRWIPGASSAHYYANSDEHLENGVLTEDGDKAKAMIDKRTRKGDTLEAVLPEPTVFGVETGADMSFVGWGGTKNVMRDVIIEAERQGRKINYLHFDYVFPIKTERVKQFFKDNDNVCLIEGNIVGQLGDLITNKTGLQFHKKFLRYNGRTFCKEEILNFEL